MGAIGWHITVKILLSIYIVDKMLCYNGNGGGNIGSRAIWHPSRRMYSEEGER